LPTRDEIPFAWTEKHTAEVRGQPVVFGGPVDKRERDEWPWKDELPARDEVDGIARQAANLSQTRVVAKGVFLRGADVLLIKDKVGFYRGRWSLPGGYLDYGEAPEQCVVRELAEECGLKGEVTRLLRLDSQVVPSGYHFLTFHYEGVARTTDWVLKEDEIEAARWVPLRDAAAEVASPHSRLALQDAARMERP
jgi:ADP-ribose pyrophosphatase YjhB (NUDIX family)